MRRRGLFLPGMEDGGGAGAASPGTPAGLSASQRRAELRRRKLLMNSEERINRIMGFHRPAAGKGEPRGAVWGSRPCPFPALLLGACRRSLGGFLTQGGRAVRALRGFPARSPPGGCLSGCPDVSADPR